MKVLYLYCHPLEESFHASIRDAALATLHAAGHEVDLCDLYAEGFQPILTAEMRRDYHDLTKNRAGIEGYVERIFGPGITFDLSDPANVKPMLGHIRHVIGISTYGRDRLRAFIVGDPPRKMVTRYLRWFVARGARIRYLALYHMNVASEAQRKSFIARVSTELSNLK